MKTWHLTLTLKLPTIEHSPMTDYLPKIDRLIKIDYYQNISKKLIINKIIEDLKPY